MKKYTFNNLNNNNNSFYNNYKYTDYSKILDDLIFDDIIKNNEWLNYDSKKNISDDELLMSAIIKPENSYNDELFLKASNFLADYNKSKIKKYFIKDKTYTLSDGTSFEITDDYIHIGDKLYMFKDFSNHDFLYKLTESEKKIICIIYTNNLKITIKA